MSAPDAASQPDTAFSHPTRMSAQHIATAIRSGDLTARAVVEAHIEVLKRHRALNAVAKPRFDAARREADEADQAVAQAPATDTLPPLLGVPVTVKELIAVAGMPNTGGFPHRRRVRPRADAPAVARLREAGAIIVAITNAAGPLYWIETNNPLYGRVNNPYDPRRTAGGSSGGDGAAVSIGGAPVALGSDLGGSLRVPAFFNGVFAHLPSVGLVPNTGHFPMTAGGVRRSLYLGPITRHAEDLHPVLQAMAGPHESDPNSALLELGDPATVPLEGMRVYLSTASSLTQPRREVAEARERAAASLEHAGAHVAELPLPELRWAMGYALATIAGEMDFAATVEEVLGTAIPRRYSLRRIPRNAVLTLASAPVAALRLAETAPARTVRTRAVRRLVSAARRASEQITATIGDGVLLHPPFPRLAPRHYTTYGQPWLLANTAAFNFLGLPATQVPMGISPSGLPTGVQVSAAPGNDHVAIRVAQHLERVTGGWTPPPSLDS